MNKAELADLRESWMRAVLLSGGAARPRPCWFSLPVEDINEEYGPCEGRLEGAHWIKRQAVEERLAFLLDVSLISVRRANKVGDEPGMFSDLIEIVQLAAWDPRNGVPACERHHRHFDGQLVDASNEFVVYRPFVPWWVEDFVADFGFETRLEQKCPDVPPDWADV